MKILMVCLGNICRSPIAQGILEEKIKIYKLDWQVDSAGTSGWHDGEHPDRRAILQSQKHNVDISNQISRKFTINDLDYYDHILVMDSANYQDVMKICKTESQKSKVNLITNFKYPYKNIAVPDPYYNDKFDEVFQLLDDAIEGLIMAIR
ncbi:MAG TPA: low molecular weight protein-tyrosine-phosphatase [Saprospiraceae bacterium]|nr:low molecular weight protein-tyrosine-phosphatase [Saprospiraceae bacterium]HMU03771.1 low molecular weight protein-tyrosine-phosphatase [Saprospiraceae bacterium]